MKILIVAGFLGAGKTTFIRRLTEKTGRDFAIFENEFGETDVDAKLIGAGENSLKVWEMTENCVCCTGKTDFLTSLMTIDSALDPEYLLVEPTGVAKLDALLENINSLGYDRLRVLPPVVIVDARAFEQEAKDFPELFGKQVSGASVIVISKAESLSEWEIAGIAQKLRAWNQQAPIVSDYQEQPLPWWEGLLQEQSREAAGHPAHQQGNSDKHHGHETGGEHDHRHHEHTGEEAIETFTLHDVRLPTPVHLMFVLDLLAGRLFGDISRAKGYLPCGQEWLRFDFVGREWAITGFSPQEQATLTFIGQDIHRQDIRRYLFAV